MIITFISFIYIFMMSLIVGIMIRKALARVIPVPKVETIGICGIVMTGLVTLTVYAEFFSIFYKVGVLCHGIIFVLSIVGAFVYKNEILGVLRNAIISFDTIRWIIYVFLLIVACFYASRGQYHTDTGIYHAQAIRILEEYGCIKGLGNFQLHFAYNSAYLALCALFTMSFILPVALHTMTGFFMLLVSIYAVEGLFSIRYHKQHGGDMARIAILIYAFSNITGLQSPATDYGTMYLVLYILCMWLAYAEEKKNSDEDISFYGFLSVLSIFAVSMKLSAAAIVLLAVYPLVLLIREKKYKEIALFICVGFFTFLPFLIRNVIISGWLFYPVENIDLFNVIWKIPVEYMRVDSAQIKVWGRCLYDINRLGDPISVWFPVWWDGQQFYGKMLICAQIMGLFFLVLLIACKTLRLFSGERIIKYDVVIFYVTVIANILLWFLTAPFIRYGLAFLLLLPLCACGDVVSSIFKKGYVQAAMISAIVLFSFFSWFENYIGDDIEFIQNYGMDGYVLWPIPFEDAETDTCEMDGVTVYNSTDEEVNSYYYYPNTCYHDMMNRTELIGSTIKEGFKPKDTTDGD